MFRPNPPGRPTHLTEELMDHIISFVPSNHTVNQVARMSCVPQPKISEWLTRGLEDLLNEVDSVYGQFTIRFREAEGKEINSLLKEMRNLGTYNSTAWLLEKCHPEDYGNEAPIMKEFRDVFRETQAIKRNDNASKKNQEGRETQEETNI